MKKVIDGKIYDTEKATRIGEASYGCSGDFHAWEEALYVTEQGRFFLAGSGGAMSRWSVPVDNNSWGGGSGIRPLTEQEALEWAEAYLDADIVCTVFADSLEEA